jgi:hypothetical protein
MRDRVLCFFSLFPILREAFLLGPGFSSIPISGGEVLPLRCLFFKDKRFERLAQLVVKGFFVMTYQS